ncbi:cytochrome P450 monooxygenase [Mycena leptocephala]|nr:cytochrome P450 monooxygenase [Mycena leptocephala]
MSAAIVLLHVIIYLVDPYGLRQYPGPFLAKFTDAWLGWAAQQGHRSEVIHDLHKKIWLFCAHYPSEVSIADPDAHSIVYAHGNGAQKSTFYDAFVSIVPGLFSTRDRVQHARKRKIILLIFSQKSVVDFAPHIRLYISVLVEQWDRLYDGAVKGFSGSDGEGDSGSIAFPFGTAFVMLPTARDAVAVPATRAAPTDVTFPDPAIKYIPAIAVLTHRVESTAAMAVLPARWRPLIARLPWYRARQHGTREFGAAGSADGTRGPAEQAAGWQRLARTTAGSGRIDGRGTNLPHAGSDTTSNVQMQNLPYLDACIKEGLRIHSTIAIDLPHVIPEGRLVVCGRFFFAGSVVGVPIYTLHREPDVWGNDPDVYRPERWFDVEKTTAMHKAFNPFSSGPRACVRRNLAALELSLIIATLLRRYHFVLAGPEKPAELDSSKRVKDSFGNQFAAM